MSKTYDSLQCAAAFHIAMQWSLDSLLLKALLSNHSLCSERRYIENIATEGSDKPLQPATIADCGQPAEGDTVQTDNKVEGDVHEDYLKSREGCMSRPSRDTSPSRTG